MNRRRRTLPPVPPKAPSELRPLIAAMTEILETGEGVRGDPLDRKVTLRDLLDSGIGRLKPGMRPGQDGNLDSGAQPPAPDLSIPPAPSGFDAQGGFYGMVNLSWSIPGQQYSNHSFTNIYRSEEDNFANAEIIGREAGAFYSDYVRDDAIDSEDPTKLKGYYYWISFTSVANVEGAPNSANGTYAAPLADLGYVLELLAGEIDEGVLAQSLREKIGKISDLESNIERLGPIEAELRGPASIEGTVANRIAQEREIRIAALDEERSERVDSLLAEQQARQEAISFEAQARQDAIHAEATDRANSVAAERDARVAALQTEQGARASAIKAVQQQIVDSDTAIANQITSLTAVVEDNSADITSEQQARVAGDASLAFDISTLQVRAGDNEAAIVNETAARIENDALRAAQLSVITATYKANTASIFSLEEIRISDREATAQRINGLDIKVKDNEASLLQEAITRANADSALASQISVLSAKIDALPTFANGFEAGLEFDRWVAAADHAIVAETSDAFSGNQSALVGSTASVIDTATTPFAVSIKVPAGTANAFASRRVRLGIAARAVTGGSAEFAIGYATSGGWFSGWHRLVPGIDWAVFEAQVEVPEVVGEEHYVVLWGDTSGSGGSVEVDRLLVDVTDAEIPEITAQIETLQQAIADNQQAISNQFNTLSTQFDDANVTINGELSALSTADEALASDIVALQTEVSGNAAAIVDEQTTRASKTDALAQQITALDAQVDETRALISGESQARADEDSALAQQISTVDARVDESRSIITTEQQARVDGYAALASEIQTLTATTGELAADIQSESTARADADEALASDVVDLWAGVGENQARITDEATARATEDELLSAVQRVISASRGTAAATFYTLDEVRLSDSAATASRIDGVEVQLEEAFSAIEQEQSLRASEDQALVTQITTAVARLGDDVATVQQTINSEVTRLDNRIDSTAQSVTTVQADLAGQLAAVQQNLNSNVTRLDGRVDSTAQALTTVQSQLGGQISTVQQNLNTQVSRINGEVNSNAQLIQSVQSGLSDNISAVQLSLETKTQGASLVANGLFSTGDMSGWPSSWSEVRVLTRDASHSWTAVREMPSRYCAYFPDTGYDSHKFLYGDWFEVAEGEEYHCRFAVASASSPRNANVGLRIRWDDEAGNAILYSTVAEMVVTSISWNYTKVGVVVAPKNAVRARVYFRRDSGGVGPLLITNITAQRAGSAFSSALVAKLQANGLIGGFGLYNDGETVDAGFDVDRFWIGRTNSDKRKPFIVQGGSVYMDTAFIRNGSIQEGQLGPITIGKLRLDDGTPVTTVSGLIRADAIDVDNLSVAEAARFYGDVQSGNYLSGRRGWRILQNGSVEFNDGQFNGTVNVDSGRLGDDVTINGVDSLGLIRQRAYAGELAQQKTDDWVRPGSTRIDGNKIYTGDAYVDTLQIKGNAVIVPVSTAIRGGTSTDDNWKTVASLTLPTLESGGVFSVRVGFNFRHTFGYSSVPPGPVEAKVRVISVGGGSDPIGEQHFDIGDTESQSGSASGRAICGTYSSTFQLGRDYSRRRLEIQTIKNVGSRYGGHSVFNRYIEVLGAQR